MLCIMQDYVPEAQRDTRWWIWNSKFTCRVPYQETMSIEYMRHFGTPASGHTPSDQQTANELVTRMLTIAEMIEFFGRGVTVAVVKVDDTKTIYERISDHLNAWKKELTKSLNIRNAPLEDLILMDKFATQVYRHAKSLMPVEYTESLLARRAGGLLRVNRETLLTKPPPVIVTATKADNGAEVVEPVEENYGRVSMADSFLARRARKA